MAMKLNLPEPLITGLVLTEQDLLFELALGLYADRKATLGQAARLAGLSRPAFLDALGQRQLPIHYDEDDLEADIQTVRRLEMAGPADAD